MLFHIYQLDLSINVSTNSTLIEENYSIEDKLFLFLGRIVDVQEMQKMLLISTYLEIQTQISQNPMAQCLSSRC